MISSDKLDTIIECALLSPYIKDEKPVSLLIIAKPESGKTKASKQYKMNKGVCYMTDCTAYGITRDILPKMVGGEIKTLIIADLITPLSRSTKTRKNFVAFLNNMIEEGVAKITTYATIWEKEVKANVITSITDEALNDGRHDWASMGFLSRFICFSYSYSQSTIEKIMDYYSENPPIEKFNSVKLPKKEVEIKLSREYADRLNGLSEKVGHSMGLYGFRAKINFRSLIKTLALRNGHSEVTRTEYDDLMGLADYFNFDFYPLK